MSVTNVEDSARKLRRARHVFDLAYALLERELKVEYKTTTLGILWGLANPLLQLLVYSFLFNRVISLDIPNYGLFLFPGLLAWTWFQTSLAQGARCITSQRDLVRQPGFPVMVLPAVSVAVDLVNLLLALPLFFLFSAIRGLEPHAVALLLPILLGLQFVLMLGPAYLVGALNVMFRDTERIVAICLQLLFFMTPVFYGVRNIPKSLRFVYKFNPMATLIEAYRDILVLGRAPNWGALAVLLAASVVLVIIGYRAFERMKNRFVEEL